MNQSPEISIIVPVYNEAASLPQLQVELLSVMRDYDHEIVFVDDGSTDDSAKQLQRSPRIRLLQFVKNCGQSLYSSIATCRTIRMTSRDCWKKLRKVLIWFVVTEPSARITGSKNSKVRSPTESGAGLLKTEYAIPAAP